jgi:hypothetical protein
VLFLHDEIVIEAPESRCHEAGQRLTKVMIEAMKKYVPDVAITTTAVAMRRWYKGARPVLINQRLVPSKPEETNGRVRWVADIKQGKK